MAVSLRLIRARVKSIKNTKKITKAMELVSAAKMRKAIAATLASRAYSGAARNIIEDIAGKVGEDVLHVLMKPRAEVKNVMMILFTSDRGLCGSYNSQILRAAEVEMKSRVAKGQKITLVAVGKRGAVVLKSRGTDAAHVFNNLSNNPTSNDIRPVARLAMKEFLSGNVDEVMIAFTEFKSALVQMPRVHQLLPIAPSVIPGLTRDPESLDSRSVAGMTTRGGEYKFEPDAKQLLDAVVPRLVETIVYQSLLESNASEHSARMMNMKNATTNASEMIEDFTLMMNQVRQAGITREISEISAGKAALE